MRPLLLPFVAVALLAGTATAADSSTPDYTMTPPHAAQLKAVTIVSQTLHIKTDDADAERKAISDIQAKLAVAHVAATGGPIFIFHHLPADAESDVEVAIPVADGAKAPDGCQARILEATPSITAIYQGSTDAVGGAIGDLFRQVFSQNKTPTGELRTRSLYYEDMKSPNNVMLLEIPVSTTP